MAGVRAAGAVVWRVRDRVTEVAVVHRPRYDDWSLPKGKLDRDERPVEAAAREVAEEAGANVALSRRLPTVRYAVGDSRKEVSYWLARWVSGEFVRNDEVDELAWLPVDDARARLQYAGDRRVLDEAFRQPPPDSVVVLVRHARAGKRSAWHGEDCERPLDKAGRRQADRLVGFLRAFAPSQIVSAEPLRCRQTVAPFAAGAGLEVAVEPGLGDAGFESDPAAAAASLVALAQLGAVTVVASQGHAIPGLLDAVWPQHRRPDTKKGHAWVLGFVDGEVASADHYADAARV